MASQTIAVIRSPQWMLKALVLAALLAIAIWFVAMFVFRDYLHYTPTVFRAF